MKIAWEGDGQWTAEVSELELAADGLIAVGTQLGADPHPYRATYELDARGDWITRRLRVRVDGAELDLHHDGAGHWDGRPDLGVHLSPQRYAHLGPGLVRFASDGFTADIEVDEHGLVVAYPQIARRVAILAP